MTAQALWRERERERHLLQLVQPLSVLMELSGKMHSESTEAGKQNKITAWPLPPAQPKKKEKNPNNSAREMGKKIGEQMQTCSCPNCILQSTSQAAGFPPCLPVFPAADGVVWFSFAAGFAW